MWECAAEGCNLWGLRGKRPPWGLQGTYLFLETETGVRMPVSQRWKVQLSSKPSCPLQHLSTAFPGNSLVVLWLGFHTSTAGARVWSLVGELRFCMPLSIAKKKYQLPFPNAKYIDIKITIRRTDCWSWNSNTLATWCKKLTHLKRPWCWERLKVGGEGDDRGWDGWMASPTQWTWAWVSSRSWWWTGKPGVLRSTGSQRVRHD